MSRCKELLLLVFCLHVLLCHESVLCQLVFNTVKDISVLQARQSVCKPIQECDAVLFSLKLIKNNQIPKGISKEEFKAKLRDLKCSQLKIHNGRVSLMVRCPVPEEVDPIEAPVVPPEDMDIPPEDMDIPVDDISVPPKIANAPPKFDSTPVLTQAKKVSSSAPYQDQVRSGLIDAKQIDQLCEGSLEFQIFHPEAGIQSPMFTRSKRNRFSREHRESKLMRVHVHGNCCWTLHSRPFRRGRSITVGFGFNEHPNITVRSYDKTSC